LFATTNHISAQVTPKAALNRPTSIARIDFTLVIAAELEGDVTVQVIQLGID